MPTPHLDGIAKLLPGARDALDALGADWSPDPPPATVVAAALARVFIHGHGMLLRAAVADVLRQCERALENGPAEEGDALATGFLEALQHADGADAFDFSLIADRLGQRSRAYCEATDAFWGVQTRGLTNQSKT